jgi:hypothetical protein
MIDFQILKSNFLDFRSPCIITLKIKFFTLASTNLPVFAVFLPSAADYEEQRFVVDEMCG